MSDVLSPEKVRSKTAKKLVSKRAADLLSNLIDVLEPPRPTRPPSRQISGPSLILDLFEKHPDTGKGELRQRNQCPECGGANLVHDHETGETICGDCGLVTREEEKASRSRLGVPNSFSVHDKGLSTDIDRSKTEYKEYVPSKEQLETVKNGTNEIMTELDKAVKNSLEDNKDEKTVQKVLSIGLFVVGLALVAVGAWQNQLVIVAIGAVPELLIAWPYRNLTKIKDENTFLYSLVPWIKTRLIPCELKDKKDMADCYKEGLAMLDKWMGQLQKSAYSLSS